MYQAILQTMPTGSEAVPTNEQSGVITHIMLNYHEVQCIEIALIGFEECIRQQVLPEVLSGINANHLFARLSYLRNWLHQSDCKSRLRFDGANSVLWPFTSSELVDWLLPLCEHCITQDALTIVSIEAANYDYADYSNFYLEDDESYSLADNMMYCHYRGFRDYYNDIIKSNQATIVDKLKTIQKNGYPLHSLYAVH